MATAGPFHPEQDDYIEYMNQLWARQNSILEIADGANIDIDISAVQRNRTVTLAGNRTLRGISGTATQDGYQFTLRAIQDATGNRTLTAGAGIGFGVDVASLLLTTTANKVDYLTFVYYHATATLHFVGFSRGFT